MARFVVTATELNLRSSPVITPDNRIATMPQGLAVTLIEEGEQGWVKVHAKLDGVEHVGWAAARFLARAAEVEFDVIKPRASGKLPPVHMGESNPMITRANPRGRAFPLGEPGQPARKSGSTADRARALTSIVDWLDVERSARHLPENTPEGGRNTFCNIYAYDYAYLAGVYLPRVWWLPAAIRKLQRGEPVQRKYGQTVHELDANSLYLWFVEHSEAFGWNRNDDLTAAQDAANQGKVVIVAAINRGGIGHIAAVVPETGAFSAVRTGGTVTRPLMSQPGGRNLKYDVGPGRWWLDPRFKHGFWIHA